MLHSLLTNRIVDVHVKPLSAGEFWSLCACGRGLVAACRHVGLRTSRRLSGLALDEAERVAELLGAGTAFSFERERLAEEGIVLVSALEDSFPSRLRERLGDSCPAFLLIAGPAAFLHVPAVGIVGSRDASDEALAVAASAATERCRCRTGGGQRARSRCRSGSDGLGDRCRRAGRRLPGRGSSSGGSQRRYPCVECTPVSCAWRARTARRPASPRRNAMGRNKLIYGHRRRHVGRLFGSRIRRDVGGSA